MSWGTYNSVIRRIGLQVEWHGDETPSLKNYWTVYVYFGCHVFYWGRHDV